MEQNKTGNSLATIFTYTLLHNERPVSSTHYNLLDAFPGYPAVSLEAYRMYTYEEAVTRSEALVLAVEQCDAMEVVNEPVNFGNC